MINKLFIRFVCFLKRFKLFTNIQLRQVVYRFQYLPKYYKLNDLMWQDGLLVDFLQKKFLDRWIRKFLVSSSYLVSERTIFKFIIKFYLDYLITPLTWLNIFEYTNISFTLLTILILIIFFLLSFQLNYFYVLLF